LCFGTSMVSGGVLPAVIERRTGLKTYNLAVAGGRPELSYHYLRRTLAAGNKPSAVLLDVHPAFISGNYKENNACWPDALGFWDCVDMAWNVRDAEFFLKTALAKALPSLAHRNQIRTACLAALRGQNTSFYWTNLIMIRNPKRNRGAVVMSRSPTYHGEVSDVYKGIFLRDDRGCDAVQQRYLHKFLRLANAHGIRVYWLVMPLVPDLQRERAAKGLDEAYDRFVRSFESYPNLVVLDARRSCYNQSAFLDACHLDPPGAYVLSDDVAEVLRHLEARKPDSQRWVALPTYRERPIDVAIEDFNQTGLALQARANRK
jgi:hypothetical protein